MAAFFDTEACLIFFGWMAFQALLAVLPVGRVVDGQPLKSGGKLKYRCNGKWKKKGLCPFKKVDEMYLIQYVKIQVWFVFSNH